jgi:type I restriction enzyme S subunit
MGNDFVIKNIPEDWEFITIAELLDKEGGAVQTGPFGTQLHSSDYVKEGIPSVMPKNIAVEGINEDGIARITLDDANRLKKYLLATGDIVYSRRGDVEKCALVKSHENGWLCGTGCLRVRLGGNSRLTPEYLHAYLSTPVIREWISRHAVGATMPNLNTGILKDVPLVVPTKKAVKFIGGVWLGLNSKIDLNQQINQTLEKMAYTLFKSWFVDFDPVFDNLLAKIDFNLENLGSDFPEALLQRAEIRLLALDGNTEEAFNSDSAQTLNKDTKSDQVQVNIHKHFPNEFEYNEQLGWIPKGWSVNSLDYICTEICRGFTSKYVEKSDLINLNQKVNKGQILEKQHFKFYDNNTQVPQNKYIQKNDILLNSLGQGTLGRVHLYKENSHNIVADQHITILRAGLGSNYVYHYLNHPAGNQRLVNLVTGSTGMQMLNVGKIRNFELPIPNVEVLDEFQKKLASINDKILQNTRLTETVMKVRDILLPKLISGELQVPDLNGLDEKTD